MEDSSMLKIRSDLYPHAHSANTMTSNNESAPSVTLGASSHTPTPFTSSMTQISVPTTYTVQSPTAPKSVSPSENKIQEHDNWRNDGREPAQRTPPASKETPSPRPQKYGATSNADYPSDNPTSPCERNKYSSSPSGTARKSPEQETVLSRVDSSPSPIPAFRRSPTSPVFPQRTFPQGIQGFQGIRYPLLLHPQERVTISAVNNYPHSLPTSPVKNIPPSVPIHHLPGHNSQASYNRSPSEDSQHSDEASEGTLDLSMSSRGKDTIEQPQATSPAVSVSKSPAASPSHFSPFGVFPGFARFHEMNPMFTEGFENAISKSPFNSSLYATNLPPHLLPWLISSQIQNLVQHQQATRNEANRETLYESSNGGHHIEDKEPQPLDLSAKRQDAKIMPEDDLVARVLEIKPSTRGRRRADNSKRSYTDFELHAALREIQSGKLGTRKAAVKYGIPRSTLRNKVYKLQLVRDNAKGASEQKNPLSTILPDSTAALRSPFINTKVDETENEDSIPCEALKTIIRKKMTEKLEELSQNSQTFLSGGDQKRLVDAALVHLCENIPKLALNTDNKTTPSAILSSLSLYPQLQDFTQRIVEERFYEEIKKINSNSHDLKLPEIPNGYNFDPGSTSINIPSYPSAYKNIPNNLPIRNEEDIKCNSSHPSSSSPTQANLKDMIAQIINQKILGDEGPVELSTSTASGTFLPLSVQRMDSSFLKTNLTLPIDERNSQDQNKKRAKSPSSGGGKGSRPKRGKYRNYDRDNLLKAVQAVQSGEMSVHRAGSFYGVPHSTLEYKVKERHLNRGKNKKDNGSVSNVMLKSEKENSTLNPVLPASVFSKEYKTDTPDTTTKEYLGNDTRPNDEISIISVHSPPSKKPKTTDPEEPFANLPITSNPFLSSPFPFWNNASPILAPFLSNPYQTDPLYASHVMSNFQKAASKLNNVDSRNSSPSPNRSDARYSESMSNESSIKAQGLFSNGGSISSTPPSSPPLQDGLLNTLLRKKMESQLSETPLPWPISSNDNQGDDYKERSKCNIESGVVPNAGLFTLKALLPSFLAARTSLAAAFNQEASNPNVPNLTNNPPQSVNPVPMMKGSPHIPVVGGACGIPLSESP